jgi:hypothetical protein
MNVVFYYTINLISYVLIVENTVFPYFIFMNKNTHYSKVITYFLYTDTVMLKLPSESQSVSTLC